MPKKSKKQKMRASMHPQVNFQKIPKLVTKEKITPDIIPDKDNLLTTHFFKIDLRKSILLISGIIALEILLYFASMSTAWFKLFRF